MFGATKEYIGCDNCWLLFVSGAIRLWKYEAVHGLFAIHFRGVTKEVVGCYNRWLLFVSGATKEDEGMHGGLFAIYFRDATMHAATKKKRTEKHIAEGTL